MVALVLQVSMSLFVLKAVSQKKWHYFVFSILIHAGVDIIAVHYGLQVITDLFAVEIIPPSSQYLLRSLRSGLTAAGKNAV